MKKHLLLLSILLLLSAQLKANTDTLKYEECRNGNCAALRSWIGAPVIPVSEYATEIVPCEGTAGVHGLYISVHHCRIVATEDKNLPLGKAVIYKVVHETPRTILPPKGRLLWLIAPTIMSTRTCTGEAELCESVIVLPFEAKPDRYELAKRTYQSRE